MSVWMHRPNGQVANVDEGTQVHENLVAEGAVVVSERKALGLAKRHEQRLADAVNDGAPVATPDDDEADVAAEPVEPIRDAEAES